MPTLPRLVAGFAYVMLAIMGSSAFAEDATRLVTPNDIATLRDANGLDLSPDGRLAVFSIAQADPGRNRYDIAWYVTDITAGRTWRVADGGDMVPRFAWGRIGEYDQPSQSVWSPDGFWVAFLRRDNGHTQIWRVRRDGQSAQQITHNDADIHSLVYSEDGRRIFFQTEPSQTQIAEGLATEARSGFLYDRRFIPVYSTMPVAPPETNFYSYDRSLARTNSHLNDRRIWVYDIAAGRERLATDAEQAQFAARTARARSGPRIGDSNSSPGHAVAWTEARDPERQGKSPPRTIVAALPSSSTPIVCAAPQCADGQMDGVWWRNDAELVFFRREGLHLQDRKLYAWRPREAQPPRLILNSPDVFTDCTIAQGELLCFYEEPQRPRRLTSINLDTGALRTLFDPNPQFAHFNLGLPPQRLAIRAASGADTYGYLVLPPNSRPNQRLPLVIVTYTCGGFLRGGVGDEYPIYAFAAQGFAVLCYNVPDDPERSERLDATAYTSWERGPGEPMRRRVEDTLDAVLGDLDRSGVIDPDRVAVTGLSYGAEIVAYALPHIPRLAAAIADTGDPGPSLYPYYGPMARETLRFRGVGRPDETPQRWYEKSFSPRVGLVRAPLLLNVADHEFLQSLDAVTALQDAGRGVELYVFPDEYHVKWEPAHRLAIYNRNIDWLNFWLRGVESGMTGDASQYVRWRAMRENQCRLFGPNGTARTTRPQGHEHDLTDDALVPWYCRPGALQENAH